MDDFTSQTFKNVMKSILCNFFVNCAHKQSNKASDVFIGGFYLKKKVLL